jgi:hypothetical protein
MQKPLVSNRKQAFSESSRAEAGDGMTNAAYEWRSALLERNALLRVPLQKLPPTSDYEPTLTKSSKPERFRVFFPFSDIHRKLYILAEACTNLPSLFSRNGDERR